MKSSKIKYGFLFPGAGMDFTKHFYLVSGSYSKYMEEHCLIVKDLLGVNLFDYIKTNKTSNYDKELLDQIVSYTINCSGFKVYSDLKIFPDVLLGYSMGIYSALACGNVFSFKIGLEILVRAYEIMKGNMVKKQGGMSVVIGLTHNEVVQIINNIGCSSFVEIVNVNSEYSVVISGLKEYVDKVATACNTEGALRVVNLKVSIPYHSKFNEKSAIEFLTYIKDIEMHDSIYPIISCINQNIIQNKKEIENELYLNLKTRISWKNTVEMADKIGFNNFVEVGTGDSLIRLSSFINRKYKFLSCQDILKGGHTGVG